MVSYALVIESRELAPGADGSLTLTRSRASVLRGNLALFVRDVEYVTAVAKLDSVQPAPEIGPRTYKWRFSGLRLLDAPVPLAGRTSGPVWLRLGADDRERLPQENVSPSRPSAPGLSQAPQPLAEQGARVGESEGDEAATSDLRTTAAPVASSDARRSTRRAATRPGRQDRQSPPSPHDDSSPTIGGERSPNLWREYMREDIPRAFGDVFNTGVWNQGFAIRDKDVFLLVTLDKTGAPVTAKYSDYFIDRSTFHWQSQNRTSRQSSTGRIIRGQTPGHRIHLFVRARKRRGSQAAPFTYCGRLSFDSWKDDNPISVVWRLRSPLPDQIFEEFSTVGG